MNRHRLQVEISLKAISGALEEFASDEGKATLEAIRRSLEEIENGLGLRPDSIRVSIKSEYGPVSFEFGLGGPRE